MLTGANPIRTRLLLLQGIRASGQTPAVSGSALGSQIKRTSLNGAGSSVASVTQVRDCASSSNFNSSPITLQPIGLGLNLSGLGVCQAAYLAASLKGHTLQVHTDRRQIYPSLEDPFTTTVLRRKHGLIDDVKPPLHAISGMNEANIKPGNDAKMPKQQNQVTQAGESGESAYLMEAEDFKGHLRRSRGPSTAHIPLY
ncbi:unnamed protein product [Protopolystoma xenopodis]|uniref:Uncharacterized protein n=1 Tax=Protopolystoma xenopodis TaxID=117903 RepID=A0A3S4ZB75_9PLAT|nr:unnamed protein product [Protopolystoma xenopodis]